MTVDPRMAFESLFGDGATAGRNAECAAGVSGSILDHLSQARVAQLQKSGCVGPYPSEHHYLDDVREIERRIQRIEKYNSSNVARSLPTAPIGVPDSFEEHVKLDVGSPGPGVHDGHHPCLGIQDEQGRVPAHISGERREDSSSTRPHTTARVPPRSLDFAKLNAYHVGLVPYFLDKLKNTPDGDGNLLDHSLVLYGSPMGDSNAHNHRRVPIFLAGHANGQLKGNLHVRCEDATPMANVLLTIMRKVGVDMDRIGDSTGDVSV